jgi:hypothetical protein
LGGSWGLGDAGQGGSIPKLPFYFSFSFKFPNLGRRFGTNPNLSTFFYLNFFSSIFFYEMGFIQVEWFSSIIWMQDFHSNLDEKFSCICDFWQAIISTYGLKFRRFLHHQIHIHKFYAIMSLQPFLENVILGI